VDASIDPDWRAISLPARKTISGTGAASGAIGAGAANFATGSPLSNGMPAAAAIGALAPLASGEAMIVGGAGVVGPVADALNGLSAVFGAFGTAVSP
jgi:hypothetical protein